MIERSAARTGKGRSARAAGDQDDRKVPDIEDPQARARQICLQLLTTRARTRAELAGALAKRGIDEETAQLVLARFSEVGLIDDAAFAESYVHSGHTYQGLGRRALTVRLRRRGIDEDTAAQAVTDGVDSSAEEQMARTLVRRRLGSGTPQTDEAAVRRLVGMLARRGYPEGLSYRVVRDELRAAGRDSALLDDVDLDCDGSG